MKKSTVTRFRISVITTILAAASIICIAWKKNTTALPVPRTQAIATGQVISQPDSTSLYTVLHLDSLGLSKEAFDRAMYGFNRFAADGKLSNNDVLSIVDFSLPSSRKRLFVIDIKNNKLLFNTFVSHGRGSGTASATHFSNRPESFQSSLGFYITGDTYIGHHGYSLRLDGQEKGINDNAFERGIVMHSANYVNEKFVHQQGYIGRSEGCPAIPESLHKAIIGAIRNGSCLFLYSPDKYYTAHTRFVPADSARSAV